MHLIPLDLRIDSWYGISKIRYERKGHLTAKENKIFYNEILNLNTPFYRVLRLACVVTARNTSSALTLGLSTEETESAMSYQEGISKSFLHPNKMT